MTDTSTHSKPSKQKLKKEAGMLSAALKEAPMPWLKMAVKAEVGLKTLLGAMKCALMPSDDELHRLELVLGLQGGTLIRHAHPCEILMITFSGGLVTAVAEFDCFEKASSWYTDNAGASAQRIVHRGRVLTYPEGDKWFDPAGNKRGAVWCGTLNDYANLRDLNKQNS